MLHNIPTTRELPSLREVLANLGNPTTKALASALGLSERTVRGYKAKGTAPKPVLIALFWVTSWGYHRVQIDAYNDAIMAAQTARMLQSEVETLQRLVDRLATQRHDACANDPATYEGVTLRARALLLRNGASSESPPIRVTIPHAMLREKWRR